jgi:hypothetical protein
MMFKFKEEYENITMQYFIEENEYWRNQIY